MSLRKIGLLWATTLLFITTVSAQGSFPILEWSPEYNARTAKFDRILEVGPDQFFTYRGSGFGLLAGNRDEFFASYNREDLGEEWLIKNERWEWKGNRVSYKSSLLIDNTTYLFYESFDRQSDTRYLLCRTLDSEANLSAPKVVETLDSRRRTRGDFAIQLSRDRSKIAIFTNPPYDRTNTENFYIRIYDKDLMELWNSDVELEYRDREVRIMDFEVSNSGEVYILASHDENPNQMLARQNWREYFLLKVVNDPNIPVTQFDLGLESVRVMNMGIECDLQNDEMAISGFYAPERGAFITGAFYLSFDQSKGEVVTSNVNAFSQEFINQFDRFGLFGNAQGLARNFVFRQFAPRPGGGSYVIAEDFEIVQRTVQTGRGTTTTNYYYYYNDIIVLSISPEGTIDWYAHIPKRQTSMNDGGYYLGYTFLINEHGLHFVYNDHRKNAKRWGNKRLRVMGNVKSSNLAMVSISHDAQMTYHLMTENGRNRFRVSPRNSHNANEGAEGAVLLSLRGQKIRFGNLYFEE